MAATGTVRPQAKVPVDGRVEFQAVHCLLTYSLWLISTSLQYFSFDEGYYCLYIYTHIYIHTDLHEQNG